MICGKQRATYRHFDEKSMQFSRYLLSVGLGKGDHIAIYAYNRIEWIEAMLACYKIGAVPININYRYVEEELAYLFDNADIKAVVYDPEFDDRLNNIRESLPLLQHYVYFDDTDGAGRFSAIPDATSFTSACETSAEVTLPTRSGNDEYVLYTGGTTGMPKGSRVRTSCRTKNRSPIRRGSSNSTRAASRS